MFNGTGMPVPDCVRGHGAPCPYGSLASLKKEKEGWYQREEDASDYGNSSNMSYLTVIPAVWLFHDIPAHSYSNSQGRKNKPEQKRKDQWQYKPGNSQLFPPNFPAQP